MHGDDHDAYDTDVLITAQVDRAGPGIVLQQAAIEHALIDNRRTERLASSVPSEPPTGAPRARRFSNVDRARSESGKGQHPTSRAPASD